MSQEVDNGKNAKLSSDPTKREKDEMKKMPTGFLVAVILIPVVLVVVVTVAAYMWCKKRRNTPSEPTPEGFLL